MRYATVDDVLDPQQKLGDEAYRSLEVFARQPAAFTDADLNGAFARVYVESYLTSGTLEVSTEINKMIFKGDGTYDYGAVDGNRLELSSTNPVYTVLSEPEETNQPITIDSTGVITAAGYGDDGLGSRRHH